MYAWQDGVPPLGFHDTAAYLVLPILLIISQVSIASWQKSLNNCRFVSLSTAPTAPTHARRLDVLQLGALRLALLRCCASPTRPPQANLDALPRLHLSADFCAQYHDHPPTHPPSLLPLILHSLQYISQKVISPPQSQDPAQQQTANILKFLPLMIGALGWRGGVGCGCFAGCRGVVEVQSMEDACMRPLLTSAMPPAPTAIRPSNCVPLPCAPTLQATSPSTCPLASRCTGSPTTSSPPRSRWAGQLPGPPQRQVEQQSRRGGQPWQQAQQGGEPTAGGGGPRAARLLAWLVC